MDDEFGFFVAFIMFILFILVTVVVTCAVNDSKWEKKIVAHGFGTWVVDGDKALQFKFNDLAE